MTSTFWNSLFGSVQLHWLGVLVVLAYAWWTLRVLSRNPKRLVYPALLVFLAATSLYWLAYKSTGISSPFASFTMGAFSALELFLFKMNTTVAIASDFFYSKPEAIATGHLVILVTLFLCAAWTTSILIVNQLASKFFSRIRLRFLGRKGNTHIFIGINKEALALMEDLSKDPANSIVAVLFPSEEKAPTTVSLYQILRGVNTGQFRQVRETAPKAAVLYAAKPFGECKGNNIFDDMKLGRLAVLADHPDNAVYCFLDQDGENVGMAGKIPPVQAEIYCFANAEGLNDKVKLVSGNQLHLMNSSSLAVMDMKRTEAIQPVHFVDVATDKDGDPLGWVKSPFHSLILGFGQAGRAALSFLYEYGAFVGKDGKAVPFHCQVIDRDARQMKGAFFLSHPGIPAGDIGFSALEVGSDDYWDYVTGQLDALNYIFIALGDDDRSVDMAIALLEKARTLRKGQMDRFCIVVKLDETEKYRKLVDFYQEGYGARCIHLVGDLKKVWSYDNVSWKRYQDYAKRYYDAYQAASGEDESWEDRHQRILNNKEHSALWNRLEIERKESQAFSNYFHRVVKDALCPSRLKEDMSVAAHIPAHFAGSHYDGEDDSIRKTLEYLAIGEHIRWQASHAIEGYAWGEKKQEDLKVHPDMKEYGKLDGLTRHYDWLVIRTTLNLLREEGSRSQGD